MKFDINEKLSWNPRMKKIRNGNRILLIVDSKWMIITLEIYQIIDEAVRRKITVQRLLNSFYEEDREYLSLVLDRLRQLGAFDISNGFELDVYLYFTQRCNLQCKHCSVSAECIDLKHCTDLDDEELKKCIDKIISLDPKSIVVTGGEPLLRENSIELLSYIRKRYLGKISLMTNGTLINKNNVKKLVNIVDNIDISIDGVDEDSCSKIRGVGVFDKVLDTISLLKEHNFSKISLSMVFASFNKVLEEEFMELNKKLNTFPIKRIFTPIGRGKENVELFLGVDSQKKCEVPEAIDESSVVEEFFIDTCGALESTVCIGNNGNIYPCSLLMKEEYVLGNIKDIDNFSEWFNDKYFMNTQGYMNFEKIFPENVEKCADCVVKDFCWGCLEVVDRFIHNDFKLNQRCALNREKMLKYVWR